MRVGAVLAGLIFLLLVALGVGAATAALVVIGLVLLAGAGTLISAFASRVRKEAAEPLWAGHASDEEAAAEGTTASGPESSTAKPYLVGALAGLTVLLGVCGVRLLDAGGDSFDAPASLTGPVLPNTPPPVTPTSTPRPLSTPTDAIAAPTAEALPADSLAPDEGERCPRGKRKQGRC